jgi:hypothetical protein
MLLPHIPLAIKINIHPHDIRMLIASLSRDARYAVKQCGFHVLEQSRLSYMHVPMIIDSVGQILIVSLRAIKVDRLIEQLRH